MVVKVVSFLIFLCFNFVVFPYSLCLNDDKVSEQCIKELFENKENHLVIKHIDEAVFKNKNEKLLMKIEALFNISKFDDIEKTVNLLPLNMKNNLYYKLMVLKTNLARKRFGQVIEMIDSIKEQYPVFYVSSSLECTRADIFLQRKQYDQALEQFDKCIGVSGSYISAYNRIIAIEKEGPPKAGFYKDYIEYVETYEGTFLIPKIVERLEIIKEKNSFPSPSSPYYTRWLSIMRKNSKLDKFFNDEYLKLPYPANSEIIKYLISKNRFSDALKIIDDTLTKLDKDIEAKFTYTVEKYRLLVSSGQPKNAADFLMSVADQYPETKKERLVFFAGLLYFEAGFAEQGKAILEEIVIQRQSSKYFLLALYKLGLIYLSEGSELYTFTMWSNFIYLNGINQSKYIGGQKVYDAILGLTQTIDRLNGFCTLTSDIDYDCSLENICQQDINNRFVTYYDYLYFHLIDREEFKKKIDLSDKSFIEKWMKNRVNSKIDCRAVLEKTNTLSKAARTLEPVMMIEQFLSFDNKNGVEFYLNLINSVLSFNEQKMSSVFPIKLPDKEVMDELSMKLAEFKLRTGGVFNQYFGKTGDIADYQYKMVSQELTHSPHYGKKEDWKLIYPTPFLEEIIKLSIEFEVPLQLIYSIMRAETFYRENLSSNVGALGLMQIMPVTFEKISKFGGIKIKDPLNPYDSMKASVWYLSKLLKRFDNNYVAAIAAYNAGPHRVSEWVSRYKGMDKHLFVEMIPFNETRDYVKKVVRYFLIYSYLYEDTYYDLELRGVVDIEEKPDVVNF